MERHARIYIAGHGGLVGSALERNLRAGGHDNLLLPERVDLDLTSQARVDEFFKAEQPEYVFVAAAKVGGVHANNIYPADFIRDNLFIQTNVIDAAHRHGVKKLLFLGSSCIYPRLADQPIAEESLLTGPLEPTNEWYAIAKIAGIKLCQALRRQHGFDAISVMPTNLYGANDNFHPENSHVIPGLMRRFHEAVRAGDDAVTVWGTGKPLREFLHVDDLADALVFLMRTYSGEMHINVGSGQEVSIRELVDTMARTTGFSGEIRFERPEMDGTPRKFLDCSRIQGMGWSPKHSLEAGLVDTYEWFKKNVATKA